MKRKVAGPLAYDEAESARISALYRSPEIARQRQAVIELLAPSADQRILDVGCRPGLQLADLARARGSAALLVGVDTSTADGRTVGDLDRPDPGCRQRHSRIRRRRDTARHRPDRVLAQVAGPYRT